MFEQSAWPALQCSLTSPADMLQVDDGYPSDRILLTSEINVITYLSDTLMVKNQPCPDLYTPPGIVNRKRLGNNKYQFPYLKGCAGAEGDLFVVCLAAQSTRYASC